MTLGRLKTLFVTGGGGGMGLEIAKICAELGMNVVLADIHRARLDTAVAGFGRPVLGIAMDVADPADWARAQEVAEARFGFVDLLVNAAAIPPCLQPILDTSIAQFDARIAANLSGTFYGIHTFGPAMRTRGSGHIVNIASEAGIIPMATLGDYAAAKFGVVGLSAILRIELAPAGVGVTVVIPGLTRTNMTVGMGMEASFVAAAIIQGVRENAAMVITHPETTRAGLVRVRAEQDAAIRDPAQPDYAGPRTQWE